LLNYFFISNDVRRDVGAPGDTVVILKWTVLTKDLVHRLKSKKIRTACGRGAIANKEEKQLV
jgi:hypothetical protein